MVCQLQVRLTVCLIGTLTFISYPNPVSGACAYRSDEVSIRSNPGMFNLPLGLTVIIQLIMLIQAHPSDGVSVRWILQLF